ncbi:MAG: aryl-alcohol dehydrogenase-like predicted oxidoreductase [Pseudohongiellaceae bacterium]|jgi:aryl-alcohol dehydrogenase-like predicted oxidoreductase
MRHRTLGKTDLSLPVITFGAWALGGGYWGEQDDDASIAAIRAALDAGIDAIDTAPVYGLGRSETIVGQAIAERRDEVTLLTKVGLRWDCSDGELFVTGKLPNGKPLHIHRNSRPDSVRHEVERSLQRLGVERLDLVQVHWPDPTTPISETMGALAELRSEGKLRAIGVSNYDVDQLTQAQAALGDVPLASNQPLYSLVKRGLEDEVLPWTRAHNVGLIVYSPLEQGLLTGKVRAERTFGDDEGRSRRDSFSAENRKRVNALLDDIVAPVAAAHHATLAQTVLAWTVQQPGITVALAGSRDPLQARENAGAGDIVLADDEWSAIDTAFAELTLQDAPAN